jgi:hypothetical protein
MHRNGRFAPFAAIRQSDIMERCPLGADSVEKVFFLVTNDIF